MFREFVGQLGPTSADFHRLPPGVGQFGPDSTGFDRCWPDLAKLRHVHRELSHSRICAAVAAESLCTADSKHTLGFPRSCCKHDSCRKVRLLTKLCEVMRSYVAFLWGSRGLEEEAEADAIYR